jgi:hypothetical protein
MFTYLKKSYKRYVPCVCSVAQLHAFRIDKGPRDKQDKENNTDVYAVFIPSKITEIKVILVRLLS